MVNFTEVKNRTKLILVRFGVAIIVCFYALLI